MLPGQFGILKPRLVLKNRNNHWLDAMALACAAAGCVGIRVIEQQEVIRPVQQQAPKAVVNAFTNPWGRSFVARR